MGKILSEKERSLIIDINRRYKLGIEMLSLESKLYDYSSVENDLQNRIETEWQKSYKDRT